MNPITEKEQEFLNFIKSNYDKDTVLKYQHIITDLIATTIKAEEKVVNQEKLPDAIYYISMILREASKISDN